MSESYSPTNSVQLITHVQAAPNITDDGALLTQTLPELKAHNKVNTGVNVVFCGLPTP